MTLNLVSKLVSLPYRFARNIITALILTCSVVACDSTINLSPQQHLEMAQGFIAEENYTAAIIEIRNALQKESNLPEARWMLGVVYLTLGRGAAAEAEIKNAIELGYTGEDVELTLLRVYLQQGKYTEVVITTASEAEAGTLSAEAYAMRGHAFLGQERRGDATENFMRALSLDNNSFEAKIGLARIALGNNDIAETIRLINEAETIAPNSADIWIIRGEVANLENDIVASESAYRRAVEISEDNALAQFGFIQTLLVQDKIDEVEVQLSTVNRYYPDHPISKYIRALIALRNNDTDEARTNLMEVLSVFPEHAESQLIMAQITYSQDQLQQSRDFIESFLAQQPDNSEAQRFLATIQTQLNETDEAINTVQTLIEREGREPQLLAMLAALYVKQGNITEGIELIEDAVELAPDHPVIRTQLATAYTFQRNDEQAVEHLKQAILASPGYTDANVMLVATHLRLGNMDEAVSVATALTELQPDNPLAHNLLGTAYNGSRELDLAREQFQQALTINPEFIPSIFNLAQMANIDGDAESAENYFRQILDIDPNHVDSLVALSRLVSQRGETDRMLALLERARTANRTALEPRLILGRRYADTGESVELLEIANEAVEIAPSNGEVQLLMARAQRMNGMIDASLRTLTSLHEQIPESPVVLFELARVQSQLGNTNVAREHLEEVLSLDPENIGALVARAQMAINDNEYILAREFANRVQDLQPDSPAASTIIGDIFVAENRVDEAITAYEMAFESNQTYILAGKLARVYEANGKSDEAITIMEQWLTDHPGDINAELTLAALYQRQNNIETAITHYQNVLNAAGNNIVALNNLSWLYIDRDLDRAYELADRANTVAPGRGDVMDTLGWVMVKQGRNEQGMTLIRRALAQYPDSPDIRYHLAFALAEAGEAQQAMDQLAEILADDEPFLERENAEELYSSLQ